MKGILIYQPTSKSAPLADFIDGLDPRLREKISSDFQSSAIGIFGSCE